MKGAVLYIHGKNGNAEEADRYRVLFAGRDVIGFDYKAQTPWEAAEEFPLYFDSLAYNYQSVEIIANSIGAFFTMSSLSERQIEKAFFISPVVNMEQIILNMLKWANVTEEELRQQKIIKTSFGEPLSWEYLRYVREHPFHWTTPTHILYGEKDNLTAPDIMSGFAKQIGATLTVMNNGEHWFHTKEQLEFLDNWIKQYHSEENI